MSDHLPRQLPYSVLVRNNNKLCHNVHRTQRQSVVQIRFVILTRILGIFLVYDFWTPPPPPPINFVHGCDRSVLTNLTRGRSARPPSQS